MSEMEKPYNPLDRVELGLSVERALLARDLHPLGNLTRFSGAGLYAIYYVGALDAYEPLAPPARERGEVPIYVGRAQPRGTRQGATSGLEATTTDPVLHARLREHAQSIRKAEAHAESHGVTGIRLVDFETRYLVVDDIWVSLGEAVLISHYRPVWNVVLDGFGNHAPGGGRGKQARSRWDELHPGREWAFELPPPKASAATLHEMVVEYLSHVAVPDLMHPPEPVDLALSSETDLDT